jgi:hypothetical protein
MGCRGVVVQDLANVLPRIPIPRTSVNKGKKKGRHSYALAPSYLSAVKIALLRALRRCLPYYPFLSLGKPDQRLKTLGVLVPFAWSLASAEI